LPTEKTTSIGIESSCIQCVFHYYIVMVTNLSKSKSSGLHAVKDIRIKKNNICIAHQSFIIMNKQKWRNLLS